MASTENIKSEGRRFIRGPEMPDIKEIPCESQDNGAAMLKQPPKSVEPSEAFLRHVKKFQEKLRAPKKSAIRRTGKGGKRTSVPDKTNVQSKSKDASSSSSSMKGKSYKTKSDQKLTEPSRRKHFLENYIYDTKNGARNSRTEFMFKSDQRLGQTWRLRTDRIFSVEDRHEEGERGEFSP